MSLSLIDLGQCRVLRQVIDVIAVCGTDWDGGWRSADEKDVP
jgi:hypothetical protein